jgi:peptide/nickel transport system ATP-binding protein
MADILYSAKNVSKRFKIGTRFSAQGVRTVHAVDNVSLDIATGETIGLVGESGCGKSTLSRCLVRLHNVTDGQLEFDGHEITHLGVRAMRQLRAKLQMVFQDPSASLNPRRRVKDLIAEPFRIHTRLSEREIAGKVQALLKDVGLAPEHGERFPHEFSGGQRQRIGVARAIALEPKLLVLDEPVSALDVSVQAQIVNLLADLQQKLGLTYVFVSHDLSVVRQVSTRIAVMYLGSIVELAPADEIFARPRHPYTQALISAVPVPDREGAQQGKRIVLQGDVPSPINPPTGCRFHPRCPCAQDKCRVERPGLEAKGSSGTVACHFPL